LFRAAVDSVPHQSTTDGGTSLALEASILKKRPGTAIPSIARLQEKCMQKITPFLWYAKEAEEAAAFYTSIFPDSRITRVAALLSESPSGPPGSVKVVDFVLFGQAFTAMSAGPLDPSITRCRSSSIATIKPSSTATGTHFSKAGLPSSAGG
jgi:hypothetical protein